MSIGTYEMPEKPLTTNGTANPALVNPFKKAEKRQIKLRVALIGPSGSGKTFTALNIAEHWGGKIALIDTEHESALRYADQFEFDHIGLDNFNPQNYIALLKQAEQLGYDTVIIDSLSHAWNGVGGMLEQVDKITTMSKSGNSFQAWAKATPMQNALVEAMLACKCHLIVTMRSKTEYVVEENEKGKAAPRKVGTAPIQRDGIEYEFDVVAELDIKNNLSFSKTRCAPLQGQLFAKPGKELADILLNWASSGKEQESPKEAGPAPAPESTDDPRVALITSIANGERKLEELKVKGFIGADIAKTRTKHIGSALFDQAELETLEKYRKHLIDTYKSIPKAN